MEADHFDSREWDHLVARLGGAAALTESARHHKAFRRPRGVRTATDVLRLALMYGPGGRSLRMLVAEAVTDGVAEISNVAVLNRLRGAADWLEFLCAEQLARLHVIDAPPPASSHASSDASSDNGGRRPVPLAERPIRLVDGSLLDAGFRLHLAYDPVAGRIASARITSSAQGEKLDLLPIEPGEIRVADRGYPKPDGLRDTLQGAAGADVVVRLTWNSLALCDAKDAALDWLALFAAAERDGGLDMDVKVRKPRGAFEPIAMRLVIVPKPPEVRARAGAAARKTNSKKARKSIDPRTLAGSGHMVLLTSLPADVMPVARLTALYRTRWQIELAFKRLKSILHWDRRPAKDERLARAWLHAHFLFALLVEDVQNDLRDDPAADSGALPPCDDPRAALAMANRDGPGKRAPRRHLAASDPRANDPRPPARQTAA